MAETAAAEAKMSVSGVGVAPASNGGKAKMDWDINDNHFPKLQQSRGHDPFEDWPDGHCRFVYSPSSEEAKKHTSGWAMRNTNNHNVNILKKSCLGVLVCTKRCLQHRNGKPVAIRPAICDKARKKQQGKICPNLDCDGVLEIQVCRGHCGYPVTHFWRNVPDYGILFQAKGFHDHSRPAAKSTGMSLKRKLHAKRERQQQLLFKQERQQQQHQLLPRQDEQKEYLAYAPPPPDQQRGGAEHCPGSGCGQPMLHSPVAAEGEVPPVQLSSSSEWEQQALAFKDYGRYNGCYPATTENFPHSVGGGGDSAAAAATAPPAPEGSSPVEAFLTQSASFGCQVPTSAAQQPQAGYDFWFCGGGGGASGGDFNGNLFGGKEYSATDFGRSSPTAATVPPPPLYGDGAYCWLPTASPQELPQQQEQELQQQQQHQQELHYQAYDALQQHPGGVGGGSAHYDQLIDFSNPGDIFHFEKSFSAAYEDATSTTAAPPIEPDYSYMGATAESHQAWQPHQLPSV